MCNTAPNTMHDLLRNNDKQTTPNGYGHIRLFKSIRYSTPRETNA